MSTKEIEIAFAPPYEHCRAVIVKRVRDAIGALCVDCGAHWDHCDPYWSWRKSQAMHERGTGHTCVMYTMETKS